MALAMEREWRADELEQRYYEWLIWMTGLADEYAILLRYMYETPFRVTLLMDENRVGDGLSMRNRFAFANGLSATDRNVLKQQRPCSVLEVMVGLAQRFDEEYMTLYSEENRLRVWIEPMIESLGLKFYDDRNFDFYGYDRIMKHFLDRTYSPDGRGSLFYIPGTDTDMRQMEIWRQMMMKYK